MKLLSSALCFLCLFLLVSVPASAQTFSYTESTMAYGTYSGTSNLYVYSEWSYNNSGSGAYQWAGGAVKFELSVAKYSSYAHFLAQTPISTQVVVYACGTGEWSVSQTNPTTAKVSGSKYIQLEQGFYYSLICTPKAYGSYHVSYYNPWSGFSWTGQQQQGEVDLTHPGDN